MQDVNLKISKPADYIGAGHYALAMPQITTTVLWLACLTVGILGDFIPYPRYHAAANEQIAPQTQMVNVEIAKDPPTPPEVKPQPIELGEPSPELSPPASAPPALAAAPEAPSLTPVAAASPAIAFALPVEGFTKIVDASHASFARPVRPATTASTAANGVPGGVPGGIPGGHGAGLPSNVMPAVIHLTLGEGEGKQPIPDYPREAAIAGEEGTVGIRFTVGENGRVIAAQAVTPCHWPLLNQSALRTVRERWIFIPGEQRICDVSIQFQLEH